MNDDTRTIYCGGLHEKVTEDLLYELFTQGGPVQRVNIPKSCENSSTKYAFVTFKHECSVPYILELFKTTSLYNRPLNLKCRQKDSGNVQTPPQQLPSLMDSKFNSQFNMMPDIKDLRSKVLSGMLQNNSFVNYNMMPGGMNHNMYPSKFPHDNGQDRDRKNNRFPDRNHPYPRDFNNRQNNWFDNKGHSNAGHSNAGHSNVGHRNRNNEPRNNYSNHRSNRHDNRRNHR